MNRSNISNMKLPILITSAVLLSGVALATPSIVKDTMDTSEPTTITQATPDPTATPIATDTPQVIAPAPSTVVATPQAQEGIVVGANVIATPSPKPTPESIDGSVFIDDSVPTTSVTVLRRGPSPSPKP